MWCSLDYIHSRTVNYASIRYNIQLDRNIRYRIDQEKCVLLLSAVFIFIFYINIVMVALSTTNTTHNKYMSNV